MKGFEQLSTSRLLEFEIIFLHQMTIFLDKTKLKAFADDKLNVAVMMIQVFDGVENTVGKEENVGYQHFLLFLQSFQKYISLGVNKIRGCVVDG